MGVEDVSFLELMFYCVCLWDDVGVDECRVAVD
jgi:hypothetical protein